MKATRELIGVLVAVCLLCALGCSDSDGTAGVSATEGARLANPTWPIPPVDQVERITYTIPHRTPVLSITISDRDSVEAIVRYLRFEEAQPCFCIPGQYLKLKFADGTRLFKVNDHALESMGADSTEVPRRFKMPAEFWSSLQEILASREHSPQG